MVKVPGFTVSSLFTSDATWAIFRATRDLDGTSFLLKLLTDEFPRETHVEDLKREYRFASRHYGENVSRAVDLVPVRNGYCIAFEDALGPLVASVVADEGLLIDARLSLAVDMCAAMAQVHGTGIVHGGVSPLSFQCDANVSRARLLGFSNATLKSMERFRGSRAQGRITTYTAPERTGRLNRSVDARADLYSLGITLYELFTGITPFTGDETELAYAHIARAPAPPSVVRPGLPRPLSDVVMKLLEKESEQRYQSAECLLEDIRYCLPRSRPPLPSHPSSRRKETALGTFACLSGFTEGTASLGPCVPRFPPCAEGLRR
jgi:serine/threonine protein kinase